MKKLTAITLVLIAIVLSAQLVNAQSPRAQDRLEIRASAAAERQENNLTNLKERGDKLIADRINSLQKLLTRVQNDKRLSDSDKTSLENDINATITNLNALKTKIDEDTDITTARTDVRSIITSYRIYEIYEPKLILLLVISNLQTADNTLSTLTQQVRILLTQLNVQSPTAKAALDDMTAQLTTINTLLSTDKTLLSNVTINTTDPKSIFTQIRKDLATVRTDFAKVRSDLTQVRNVVKASLSPATGAAKPTGSTQSSR